MARDLPAYFGSSFHCELGAGHRRAELHGCLQNGMEPVRTFPVSRVVSMDRRNTQLEPGLH